MLSLYFGIGRYVSYKTQTEKWGAGVIDTISEAWGDSAIWPSATAKLEATSGVAVTVAEFLSISFLYHMEILSGVKKLEERLFYIHEAAQNKWKERQLRESIKRDDFHHRGAMPSNFAATIPDATLARKTLAMFRDEYLLACVPVV